MIRSQLIEMVARKAEEFGEITQITSDKNGIRFDYKDGGKFELPYGERPEYTPPRSRMH